ncbi:MAG: DUF998 domain-containing protein [Anaerolineales bacterium]
MRVQIKPKDLAWCGVVAPLLFTFMTILGGALRPGYSHISDTVSELMSPGSPNRLLLSFIFSVYALLMVCFGAGLLRFVRSSAQPARSAVLGACLFILAGVINVTIATVFPQDPWGTPLTFPGLMHFILSGVIGLLQLIAVGLLGLWLRRTGLSPALGAYSMINAGALLLSIGLFLKMTDTLMIGLAERILVLVGLVWTFVMGWWMVKMGDEAQPMGV